MTAVDTERRCERTDLLVSQCVHCRPARDLQDEELLVAASLGKDTRVKNPNPAADRRTAQFDSWCPGGCGTRIHAGDEIVHDQDDGRYTCVACGGPE